MTFFSTREAYTVDPYNSTLYRFTYSASTPTLFLQQYTQRQVPSTYGYSRRSPYDDDATGVSDNSEQDDQGVLPSEFDSDFEFEKQPPTLHLVQPIKVQKEGAEFTAGVSGVQVSSEYVQQLLENSTEHAQKESEFSCVKTPDKIRCYLLDLSGYIMASNQPLAQIFVGDFLGVIDPALMRYLVENRSYFEERPEYNYAALCEDPIDCDSGDTSAAPAINHISFLLSLPFQFISTFLQSSVAFMYQLNITVLRYVYFHTAEVTFNNSRDIL